MTSTEVEEHTGIFHWNASDGLWTVWWMEVKLSTGRWLTRDLVAAERIARRILMDQLGVYARKSMEYGFTFDAFMREMDLAPKHQSPWTLNPWTDRIDVKNERPAVVKYALPNELRRHVLSVHIQDVFTVNRLKLLGHEAPRISEMMGAELSYVETISGWNK